MRREHLDLLSCFNLDWLRSTGDDGTVVDVVAGPDDEGIVVVKGADADDNPFVGWGNDEHRMLVMGTHLPGVMSLVPPERIRQLQHDNLMMETADGPKTALAIDRAQRSEVNTGGHAPKVIVRGRDQQPRPEEDAADLVREADEAIAEHEPTPLPPGIEEGGFG